MDAVQPVVAMDVVQPVNVVEPVNDFEPVNLAEPMNYVNPVNLVEPVGHVQPVDLVDPVNPMVPLICNNDLPTYNTFNRKLPILIVTQYTVDSDSDMSTYNKTPESTPSRSESDSQEELPLIGKWI